MAAAAPASSSSSCSAFAPLPTPLSLDKAAAVGGGDRAVDCGICAICLDKIALRETALVKGCDHAYCVTCILSCFRSPSIRIGNRRWGDNGYIRGGRREARPVSCQSLIDSDAGPSRTPKKKEASGSGSVSKDVAGRRARRAQKREAADKAAAEKHLKHLQRLGLRKAPPAEVGPQVDE